MSTEIGGKCITLYVSADHRRFRSKLHVWNTWRWCSGWRQGQAAVRVGDVKAWLRCPWAVAGPGRASRRRAERSSRRGRLAGGQATRRPEIRRSEATPEIRRHRPRAHTATKPSGQQGPTAPETPAAPQAPPQETESLQPQERLDRRHFADGLDQAGTVGRFQALAPRFGVVDPQVVGCERVGLTSFLELEEEAAARVVTVGAQGHALEHGRE